MTRAATGDSPMNIQDAILVHARWKTKLITYLKTPDGTIDIGQLEADNNCELGRWLYGDGARYGALPEYTALQSAHAKFHHVAAKVARSANLAPIANAEAALSPTSEFGVASSWVVNAIKVLAHKIS
jgi:hypothetical protein